MLPGTYRASGGAQVDSSHTLVELESVGEIQIGTADMRGVVIRMHKSAEPPAEAAGEPAAEGEK